MKNIKKLNLFILFVMVLCSACDKEGEIGPQGPKGEQGATGAAGSDGTQGNQGDVGEQGEQGDTGEQGEKGGDGEDKNSNATLYSFPGVDFTNKTLITVTLSVTEKEYESSSYLVYLVNNSGFAYAVPGFGGAGLTEYRGYSSFLDDVMTYRISKASGPGEVFAEIRLIEIVSTSVVNGKIAKGDLDLNDYEAVAKYYGL